MPGRALAAVPDSNGWPIQPELNGLIERMLPRAVGYWRVAGSLIGLLGTMPLADQVNVGLPCGSYIPYSC